MGALILMAWIVLVVVGAIIGERKGRLAMGIIASVVLGWIGVVLLLFVAPRRPDAKA